MKNTNIKYQLNSWVVTLVVITAVILINIIITNLSAKLSLKIDLTGSKQFVFSQETLDVMASLDKDIKVSVLGAEESISPVVKEYLERYRNLNNKLKIEFIDIYKNQAVLYTYQAKGENLSSGDLLLESEGRYKIVSASQLYSQALSLDESEQKYNFELEIKMTNAIVTVSGMMEESAIYFLEGHGEQQSSALPQSLNTQGYKNSAINITNNDIPSDAKLLISFTPNGDFTQDECEKIDKFLENGGNLMIVYTPGVPKLERLEKYLAEWGIIPHQNLVLEKDPSKIGQNEVMIYPDLTNHEITKTLISQKLPLMFIGSVSFDINESNTQRAAITPIVKTSPKAIGKANIESANSEYEQGDYTGPLNLAVVAEKTYPKTSRIMVVGSAYAVELPEQYTGSKANSEFVSSSIAWLTNNQTNLKIAPKVITEGRITSLTKTNMLVMQYLLVWVIPVLILVAGMVIWLRRRYL